MCTQRVFSSCDGILKYKLKVGLVIGCAKTLNEANVYSHYNKTNKYVFYFIKFYFTYIVSNWDPNLHFMR